MTFWTLHFFFVTEAEPVPPPDTSSPEIELWFLGDLLLTDALGDELQAQTYFLGED